MVFLLLGVVLFIGVHSLATVGLRDRAVALLGEGPWKGAYALISIVGLVAMVYGYGLARGAPTLLWAPPTWTRHLALLVMLPVFPLLTAAYAPGRIGGWVKHPMLFGTVLWALAHLLANGMLHDLVLFGAFLGWSVLTWVSYSWRERRPIPGAPPSGWNDVIALVVGLGLYALFVFVLHGWLFGVAPLG